MVRNFEDGWCYLYSDAEDSDPSLVYYYENPDTGLRGFGFNIKDGGGFLPEGDINPSTRMTRVSILVVA
jgi:hypothetical protein